MSRVDCTAPESQISPPPQPCVITNDVVVVTKILQDGALFTADKYQVVASATDTCAITTTKQIEYTYFRYFEQHLYITKPPLSVILACRSSG